ncbi:YbjQ family protein [Dorea longicatena]|uniref:YbjQ family protein n=2 Tax=Dorea longicatena TaxID=88431 RepID=A0A414SUZ3_9FIRM|nr:YbjQ family protein [Dorea longicatena]
MGTCKICGKNFGLMGGGSEPYTGHNLQVCNSCGEVLKKIDKVKNEDTQEVKDLFVSVMSMTDDADVKQILTDYSKSVISDSEKLVAITNESKEKAERAQNIEENFYDLEKAFKVTTGYDFEGYQIVDYKGIVSGDIVLGTGFISEFAASWSDAFGTTSNTFAGKMKTAKQKALKQLMANAMITGANAVIGIDFDYTMFGNNMLGVSANGTAVVIRKK